MRFRKLAVLLAVILTAVLFVPIPQGSYDDGGTREYTALTYKIVDWNRLNAEGTYSKTKVYWFPNNFQSIDQLWKQESKNLVHCFTATILQLADNTALVQPINGEPELDSSDQISLSTAQLDDISAQVGSEIVIYYTGEIMESYPAQIHAVKWELSKDHPRQAYSGLWLNKETAEKCDYEPFDHIVITEIYADCFFATPAIPSPWMIKLNGQLPEQWCVGDQVICTYKNTYRENSKFETDFLTVDASDWAPEPGMAYKPVIYLYPETETDVSVKLITDGKLTCTYPAYNNGWKVSAAPDGTLTDIKGQTYNYLYWEGQTLAQWDLSKGFCVKGTDTAVFLEQALEKLGLNRREANEFIVYWLPLMEKNPYNIISFQTDAYTNATKLEILPTPDSLIRVFMAWKASDIPVSIEAQELSSPERGGFTAVEWGGTEITE